MASTITSMNGSGSGDLLVTAMEENVAMIGRDAEYVMKRKEEDVNDAFGHDDGGG